MDDDLWDKRAAKPSQRSQAYKLVQSALFQHILYYYKIKKNLKKGYVSVAIRNHWNLYGRESESSVGTQLFVSVSVSLQTL